LNEMWMSKLAYLRDVFCHLNKLRSLSEVLYKYVCTEEHNRH